MLLSNAQFAFRRRRRTKTKRKSTSTVAGGILRLSVPNKQTFDCIIIAECVAYTYFLVTPNTKTMCQFNTKRSLRSPAKNKHFSTAERKLQLWRKRCQQIQRNCSILLLKILASGGRAQVGYINIKHRTTKRAHRNRLDGKIEN